MRPAMASTLGATVKTVRTTARASSTMAETGTLRMGGAHIKGKWLDSITRSLPLVPTRLGPYRASALAARPLDWHRTHCTRTAVSTSPSRLTPEYTGCG